jgi:hypothetical protein
LYNSCPTNHDPSATLHELDANIVVCLWHNHLPELY